MVALLLALAALAERAGGASFPVRFVVLSLLRHAEDVGWAFVAGTAAPPRDGGEAPIFYRNDPAEAARLALSLRVLAVFVAGQAAQAPARASPAGLRDFILARAHPRVPAQAAFPAYDTS